MPQSTESCHIQQQQQQAQMPTALQQQGHQQQRQRWCMARRAASMTGPLGMALLLLLGASDLARGSTGGPVLRRMGQGGTGTTGAALGGDPAAAGAGRLGQGAL